MSKQLIRTWFATLGGCLVGAVIVFLCIVIALVLYKERDFLKGLVAPLPTTAMTVTLTATPIPPTQTHVPTLTATPDPARIFGDPILAQIANRQPDHQDDFSNQASGWDTGRQDDGTFVGTRNYVDGKYVMVADAASPYQMKTFGYGYVSGYNHKLVAGLKDYVFQVEQTWIRGSGFTMINLYDSNNYAYSVRLSQPVRAGGFWLESPIQGPDTAVIFSNDILFPYNATEQSRVQITFTIQGQEFAIFADGKPIYYSSLSGQRKMNLATIEFRLLTDSSTNPIEIHWDNLKIWDLNR
jgi:hypothetical protein